MKKDKNNLFIGVYGEKTNYSLEAVLILTTEYIKNQHRLCMQSVLIFDMNRLNKLFYILRKSVINIFVCCNCPVIRCFFENITEFIVNISV